MKCINDELIQKYIDGEASVREVGRIEKHIANCSLCAQKVEEQRTFAGAVKRNINNMGRRPVIIPEFIAPVTSIRRINIKTYLYAVSAACVIFLVIFLFHDHNKNESKNDNKEIRMIYGLEGDYDSNRTVSQQEMVIMMIDSNGKITEY